VTWKHYSFLILCLHASLLLLTVPGRAQVGQKPPAMGIPESPNLVGDTTALAGEAQRWLAPNLGYDPSRPAAAEPAGPAPATTTSYIPYPLCTAGSYP